MNAVEKLLDLKAALLKDITKENLCAFSIALLDAPLFIPCEFQVSDFDPDFSNISQFKQGTILAWKGPDYKPVTVELAEKNGSRSMQKKAPCPRNTGSAVSEQTDGLQ